MPVYIKSFTRIGLSLRIFCCVALLFKNISTAPSTPECETDDQVDMESHADSDKYDEEHAKRYLYDYYNKATGKLANKAQIANFQYQTDLLNEGKKAETTKIDLEIAAFQKQENKYNISKFEFTQFQDKRIEKMFRELNILGPAKLEDEDFKRLLEIGQKMETIYSTAKVCPLRNDTSIYEPCDLSKVGLPLEPDLSKIMAQLQDSTTLAYYWQQWRDATGKRMRKLYIEYIQLMNKVATLNGFKDYSEMLIRKYESPKFKDDMDTIWQIVNEKLYRPLFFYVRHRLRQNKFKHIEEHGTLPAHLLGNMWAQTWDNLLPYVAPYPEVKIFDATEALKRQAANCGSTKYEQVLSFFETVNDFFIQTGMLSVEESYSSKAMLIRPDDGREVVCHASAWDMSDGEDFRVKMCTQVEQDDFYTVHHELGHIQYFKQYKDLHTLHRDGANPGFHEAIGDVIALSAMTPKHLRLLGLLEDEPTKESVMNNLMKLFLSKVAFLPYAYLLDLYRWRLYSGEIPISNLTYNWIKMRGEYQGVSPPLYRSEIDFDAGAKHHVPAAVPYIRYFFSVILQFQIQKKLCQVAEHTGPLYDCDIYQNQKAGKLLSDIMKRGASSSWQQTLKETIGEEELKADAIIEYFQPLLDFIKAEQEKIGYSTIINFNPDEHFNVKKENDTIDYWIGRDSENA